MASRSSKFGHVATLLAIWIIALGACSTPDVIEKAPHDPELDASGDDPASLAPPKFAQVPHPDGFNVSDIRLLFREQGAPTLESLKDCDTDFKKLLGLTQSTEEIHEGARELIRKDPVHYHWCFYSKVLALEDFLAGNTFITDRQKNTLDTYAFLVPIARGFMSEFHDSRYLRWAAFRYRQISERVFFRKLELSPQATEEFVDAANPFGTFTDSTKRTDDEDNSPNHVIRKYHLGQPSGVSFDPAANAIVPQVSGNTPPAPSPPNPASAFDPELDGAGVGQATPPGELPQSLETADPLRAPAAAPSAAPPPAAEPAAAEPVPAPVAAPAPEASSAPAGSILNLN